jgi:DNA-binding transcriptional LysR family regulator
MERRDVAIDWHPVGFPVSGRSALDGRDVGLFLNPRPEPGLSALTLDTSPMAVAIAAGHRLASADSITVDDILDEAFPGSSDVHPEWRAFWTLDEQRGEPARRTDDDVRNAEQALSVIATGRAIGTVPGWMATGLAHAGIVTLPLSDGPPVKTSLVWRSRPGNAAIEHLVELAAAWVGSDDGNGR